MMMVRQKMLRQMPWAAISLLLLSCSHTPELSVRVAGKPSVSSTTDAAERGRTLLRDGNTAMAIETLRQAIRHDPDSVVALNALGVAYDRVGRFELSRRYYEQALALEPANSLVLGNLAFSMRLQGREREAMSYAEEARRLRQPRGALAAQPEPLAPADNSASVRVALPDPSMPVSPDAGTSAPLGASVRVALPSPAIEAPAGHSGPRAQNPSATAHVAGRLPSLRVVNAVGRKGMARRFSEFADGPEWSRRELRDSRTRPHQTLIIAPRGPSPKLQALVQSLPFRPRIQSGRDNSVVVILGRDAVALDRTLLGGRTG